MLSCFIITVPSDDRCDRNVIEKACGYRSTVLGSYAHFMWEAEEDEDEEIEFGNDPVKASPTMPAMMVF